MAVEIREPYVAVEFPLPFIADDMETLEDVSILLSETGHPASVTTIRRWIKRNDFYTERDQNGRVLVSFSDILIAHRDMVRRREGF
jgi:TusA-related sulfurtransferase